MVADQVNQDFTFGKQWTGGGADNLASNAANWTGNAVPVSSDVVRFSVTNSTKGCTWNLPTSMKAMELKVGYSSTVVAAVDMMVGTVTIEAGQLFFSTREVQISGHFNQSGGSFSFSAGGTAIWTGSSFQRISMVKSSLGSGRFQNYFANFRVQSSSTVFAASDLVIDETFNIGSGTFQVVGSTLTLSGGTQSGAGGSFNWDTTAGTAFFSPGSGQVLFDSRIGGSYLVKQGTSNAFWNFSGGGSTALTFGSNITINRNFDLSGGDTVNLNLGNAFVHNIAGAATIGPASTSGTPTFSLGASTITFQNGVVIGTATALVRSGLVNIRANSLTVTAQGSLSVPSGQTGRFVLWNGTAFNLNRGSLLIQGSTVLTSSAPAVSRFSTSLNGTVDVQNTLVLNSMDANGFRIGAGATVNNLTSLDFENGVTAGTALNFDPVTQANVTVDFPIFDVSFSTNVRAVVDPLVYAGAADIDVIRSTGGRDGVAYEYDPSSVVNWGTLGTPTGFAGTTLGVSSITWSWTTANHPIGFRIMSSTGGTMSPTLGYAAVSWTEMGLSTNTQYARSVQAFTDVGTADSSLATRYTDALPAANLTFTSVFISSLTLAWSANSNPAPTLFLLERSTDDVNYTQISSGTLAAIAPFTDTGLTPERLYYYRVKTKNGEGAVVPTSVKASTTTLAVPAPVALAISPSTVTNLGQTSFTIGGGFIQPGATVRLKRSPTQVITTTVFQVLDTSSMTATFNMTGSTATTWDVEITNPDGKISFGSGSALLRVTDAVSASPITIQRYDAASALTFNTVGNDARLTLAAGAMPDGRIYVSADPVNSPLTINPALITSANAALSGWTLVPGSIREILAFSATGRFTSAFTAAASLGIGYVDANLDGIVDSVSLRASTLRLMNLNETTGTWQIVSGATVDTSAHLVSATLNHLSVYALFGSPASDTLAEAKVYPSPWKMGSAGRFGADALTIANLTESGTIRIYTLDATLVAKIPFDISNAGQAMWDGKNIEGQLVKSGVYLIAIKSDSGETKTLKLGIQR